MIYTEINCASQLVVVVCDLHFYQFWLIHQLRPLLGQRDTACCRHPRPPWLLHQTAATCTVLQLPRIFPGADTPVGGLLLFGPCRKSPTHEDTSGARPGREAASREAASTGLVLGVLNSSGGLFGGHPTPQEFAPARGESYFISHCFSG